MKEKIMTLHPDDKAGVNIDAHKYEQIKTAILGCVQRAGELSFSDLIDCVDESHTDFDGSIAWYVTTVKLDLEARGLIERVPSRRPQHVRLA